MTRRLHHLQQLGIAPSTQRTYQAGVRRYERFCSLYDVAPWPTSELTLRYFCTHTSRSLSHATILVYLAAIRHHHLQLGLGDPLTRQPLLAYLCKGIKRYQGTQGRVRLPLTGALLKEIKSHLWQATDLRELDKLALWAALTLAFHAFLRASEFTSPTTTAYSPNQHLLKRDIHLTHNCLVITVKASKSDPFRASCTLPVAATGTSTCPVRAMRGFLNGSRHMLWKPLFTLSSGEFLTRARLTHLLRKLLQATGMSAEQSRRYGSHSLRIGAATDAAAAGLPDWLIQAAERWKSTVYHRYIRSPRKALLRVAPALAAQARS